MAKQVQKQSKKQQQKGKKAPAKKVSQRQQAIDAKKKLVDAVYTKYNRKFTKQVLMEKRVDVLGKMLKGEGKQGSKKPSSGKQGSKGKQPAKKPSSGKQGSKGKQPAKKKIVLEDDWSGKYEKWSKDKLVAELYYNMEVEYWKKKDGKTGRIPKKALEGMKIQKLRELYEECDESDSEDNGEGDSDNGEGDSDSGDETPYTDEEKWDKKRLVEELAAQGVEVSGTETRKELLEIWYGDSDSDSDSDSEDEQDVYDMTTDDEEDYEEEEEEEILMVKRSEFEKMVKKINALEKRCCRK